MPKGRLSGFSSQSLLQDAKNHHRWICWAEHRSDHIDDKVPVDTSNYIKSRSEYQAKEYHKRDIWMSHSEAKRIAEESDEITGIGLVMRESPFFYIDIDECIIPNTLQIDENAYNIIERIDSYVELSRSRTGVHIIARGSLPQYGWGVNDSGFEIELYDGSWVDVTEYHLSGTDMNAKRAAKEGKKLAEEFDISTDNSWN